MLNLRVAEPTTAPSPSLDSSSTTWSLALQQYFCEALTMHHLFAIPELLDWVLSMCEDNDLASCARVCHLWKTPSLRILWSDADFPHLLSLLGDIHVSHKWDINLDEPVSVRYPNTLRCLPCTYFWIQIQQYSFQGHINLDEGRWERYQYYSNFPQGVALCIFRPIEVFPSRLGRKLESRDLISPDTISQLHILAEAMRCPALPGARTLALLPASNNSLHSVMLLLCDNLTAVYLDWSFSQSNDIIPVLRRLEDLKNLRELDITGLATAEEDVENSIVSLVDSALQLTMVQLSTILFLKPRVWESLKRHRKLSRACSGIRTGVAASLEIVDCHYLTFSHGFACLTELSCPLTMDGATLLLSGTSLPPLKALYLSIQDATNDTSVSIILDRISYGFARLTSLRLIFTKNGHGLHLDDILPITRLTELIRLEITNDTPAVITDDNYKEFASKMPQLEKVLESLE